MTKALALRLRDDLDATLASAAGRTALDPPGGAAWLAAWAAASFTAGAVLVLACGYQGGFAALNAWGSTYPDWVWQCLTALGDERVAFAFSLFLARARPRVFWALILAGLLASLYGRGLKPLLDMPRPPAVLDPGDFNLIGPAHRRASFPSGHSVVAGVFFGALVYYTRWIEVRLLLVPIAVLVGLSRVTVGVHWPVDVAFGLFGGVLAAWAGARLAARWSQAATDPAVHLAFVTLAAVFAYTLTYWDGGYPLARLPLAALGWTSLAFTIYGYLLRPLALELRRPMPGRPKARTWQERGTQPLGQSVREESEQRGPA